MAIAWWMDTGIYLKMAADISAEYGTISNFWARPKIRGITPLDFSHVGTAIIIFGVATFTSFIAFAHENFNNKKKTMKNKRRKTLRELKRARTQRSTSLKPLKISNKAWA